LWPEETHGIREVVTGLLTAMIFDLIDQIKPKAIHVILVDKELGIIDKELAHLPLPVRKGQSPESINNPGEQLISQLSGTR
jgi:hypothetical protein